MAAIQAERMRRSFKRFIPEAWRAIYPSKPLVLSRYIGVISDHLQAVFPGGDIRRLLMELPPNTLKSTIISVFWPAWVWTFDPSIRWLFCTNESSLAERDADNMRDLITSEWYVKTFGPNWAIRNDIDAKSWFANSAGGHRISYSVDSKVTGKKGDILVTDDANDAKKVKSAAQRRNVNEFYDEAFSGRFTDEIKSPSVVSGQRLHKEDLIGHLKTKPGWECLTLAEEYEPSRHCRTKIWEDWRTSPGEWLRPERFGPNEKRDAISRMGSRGYMAQHNQNPTNLEGAMFKRGWFRIMAASYQTAFRVRYWDLAHTDGGGCFTTGVLISRNNEGIFSIENVIRVQESALARDRTIETTTRLDASRFGHVITVIEGEPAGGKEAAERLVRMLAGFDCRIDPARNTKEARAEPLAAQAEAGNVVIIAGDWNEAFLDELTAFPDSQYKDQVDAAAAGLNFIARNAPGLDSFGGLYSPEGESPLDSLPDYTF